MITGMDHVAVVTSDVARAAEFYTNVLGFREVQRLETTHSGTLIFVALGTAVLELFGGGQPREPNAPNRVGYRHICLSVDDVDAEVARLKGRGVQFDMEPATVDAGLRIAFFHDPDGNPIELMQRPR